MVTLAVPGDPRHDTRMTPGGRLSAAIDVLGAILTAHRPAADALNEWGRAHRFAGSADRAAIGNLVYDVLRRKLSIAARMGSEEARALIIGGAASALGQTPEQIAALCTGTDHGPAPLTYIESEGLARALPPDTPAHIRADVPEWLWPSFEAAFGADAEAEGHGLATRAPVDMRVNTLKADRGKVLAALAPFGATPTPHSPLGLRIAAPTGAGRTPNVQAEAAFQKGWFEVQDEGSQLAALIAAEAAGPAAQVLDFCAGGGGKTLAIAAKLANKGQVFAHDSDRHRLAPIHDRLKRAGTRNVQVLGTRGPVLEPLMGRMDCVLVDAPCSGTGVWRRRPEAKWRLTPEQLAKRIEEQHAILDRCLPLLKPGGRLVYVTCSLLPQENEDQIAALLARHPTLHPADVDGLAARAAGKALPANHSGAGLTLTPHSAGTDGFFVAVLLAPV